MISDGELQVLWVTGAKEAQLVKATGQSKDAVNGRIARLRKREGEERWPRRPGIIKAKNRPPALRRAGKTTLPALGSLT